MATRPCVDCDCPIGKTNSRYPVCGSKDPFGRRDTLLLVSGITVLLTLIVSIATLSIRFQY
jgi:hypothetical protein